MQDEDAVLYLAAQVRQSDYNSVNQHFDKLINAIKL